MLFCLRTRRNTEIPPLTQVNLYRYCIIKKIIATPRDLFFIAFSTPPSAARQKTRIIGFSWFFYPFLFSFSPRVVAQNPPVTRCQFDMQVSVSPQRTKETWTGGGELNCKFEQKSRRRVSAELCRGALSFALSLCSVMDDNGHFGTLLP